MLFHTYSLNGSVRNTSRQISEITIRINVTEIRFIEVIHLQFLFIIILGRISTIQSKRTIAEVMLPIAVWHHLIETERHAPTMTGEIIERLIIEHAHQLRLGWLAVWSRDVQGPLLLLSWS